MIIFARHGQTVAGSQSRYEGYSDSPLTGLGKKQAQALGEYCKKEKITKIISSPLPRAFTTALIAGGIVGIAPATDNRLKEVCYGAWEGVVAMNIRNSSEWQTREKDVFHYIHPGKYHTHPGESYQQLYIRSRPFFEEMMNEPENILIVAHKGIMRCVVMYYTKISEDKFMQYNPENNHVLIVQAKNRIPTIKQKILAE